MNKIIYFFFVFLVFTLFLLPFISATDINSCQTLSSSGTYTLTQNVTSAGTCFTIGANNIVLDCQGYTINYASSSLGYGISDTGGYNNITIKNCNLDLGSATNGARAIYFYGSRAENILIENVSFSESISARTTIAYLYNVKNVTVKDSRLFYNVTGGSGAVSGIYVSGENVNIVNNTVGVYYTVPNHWYQDAVISLSDTGNVNIENNTLYNYNTSIPLIYPNFIGYSYPNTWYISNISGNTGNELPINVINTDNQEFNNYDFNNYSLTIILNSENITIKNSSLNRTSIYVVNSSIVFTENTIISPQFLPLVFFVGSRINVTNNNLTGGTLALLKEPPDQGKTIYYIMNNYINISGDTALYFVRSSGNALTIFNNTLITSGTGAGVIGELYLKGTSANISNNTIIITGASGRGINFRTYTNKKHYIHNNYINIQSDSAIGIYIDNIHLCPYPNYAGGGEFELKNNYINGTAGTGIAITDNSCGKLYIINTTVAPSLTRISIPTSHNITLYNYWYLDAKVTYENGTEVEGANVTGWDNENNLAFTNLTNSSGFIERQTLLEYMLNATGTYYKTNYTCTATKPTFKPATKTINLTTNIFEFFTLEIGFDVDLISPANNSRVYDAQQSFKCNATSYIGNITNATFRIWNSDNELIYSETRDLGNNANYIEQEFNYTLPYADTFHWNCEFSESSGITMQAEEDWFIRFFPEDLETKIEHFLFLFLIFLLIPMILLILSYYKEEFVFAFFAGIIFLIGGIYFFRFPLLNNNLLDNAFAFLYLGSGLFIILNLAIKLVKEV